MTNIIKLVGLLRVVQSGNGVVVQRVKGTAKLLVARVAIRIHVNDAVDGSDLDGFFLAVHVDESSLSVAGLVGLPVDVLENSVVGVVDGNVTDQVAELVEEPGEVDSAVHTGLIEVEGISIVIVLLVDGVLVGLVVDLGLSADEGISLANDLNGLDGLSLLVAGEDDLGGVNLVDVDEEPVTLSVVVALDIQGLDLSAVGAVSSLGGEAVEGEVSVADNVTLGVGLLSNDLVDIGEVGVDHDHAVAALDLVELDLLALLTEGSLGDGSNDVLVVLEVGSTVGVLLNDGGGLLHAQSLADVALGSGNVEGSVGSGGDGGVNGGSAILVLAILGVSGIEPDLGGTTPDVVLGVGVVQAEVLHADGDVVLEDLAVLVTVQADVLIAERSGVGDHGGLDRTEQDLSNQLTGSGSAEVGGLGNVLENAELLSILSNVQRPVSTGELVVLVVADSAEDHSEDFIAGHVAGGLEGAIGITLDEFSVGAVADVTGSPAGTSHVAELVVGGIHAGLVVLGDVGGVDTIDDRSHLSAGDLVLGLEGTVLITLENTHTIEDGDSFSVIFVDLLVGLEGIGADGQRQSHDQSQHHCE